MAKSKGTIGVIILSVLLSVTVTGTAGYFLLPKFTAPALAYGEWDTYALLYDSDVTWDDIPDTEINITIKKNSRISCVFSASYYLWLHNLLGANEVRYFFAISIENVGNKTFLVQYWDDGGTTDNKIISSSFSQQYISDPLPRGTYRIYVKWRSYTDSPGTNYILLTTASYNYTRTLSAMEIYT